jgi:mutual gliding-motility protein MglA
MPIVDHATRLITCKLVYCGPGRSGKTTNLSYLHTALPGEQVGHLTSLATRRDRTLFFDYMPVDLGKVGAYNVRFQLYTVPGQPYYKAIRQLVLQGADGVAFVADSQRHRWDDNLESLQDMHANLAEHGVDARSLPMVLQYNKQDLPESLVASVSELSAALNFRDRPEFAADALRGQGVFDTLRSLGTQVLRRLGAEDGTTAGDRARQALQTPLANAAMQAATVPASTTRDDIFAPLPHASEVRAPLAMAATAGVGA